MPLTNLALPPTPIPYTPIPGAGTPPYLGGPYAPQVPRLPGYLWGYQPPAYQPVPSAWPGPPSIPAAAPAPPAPGVAQAMNATTVQSPVRVIPTSDPGAVTVQSGQPSISSQLAQAQADVAAQRSLSNFSPSRVYDMGAGEMAPSTTNFKPNFHEGYVPPAPPDGSNLTGFLPPPPGTNPVPQSMWTRDLLGSSKIGHALSGIGTGIGANAALSTISDRDFNSSPLGRILGATRRGIGYGAFMGPVGGIVGGLGAGVGEAGLEAGKAVADTGVGKAIIDQSDARATEMSQYRDSDNPLAKLYGYVQGTTEAFDPRNLLGQGLRLLGQNDLEQTNVGNAGEGNPAESPEAKQQQAAAQRQAEADQFRQQRIAAATPSNLDAAMGRLNVSPQARQQVLDEFLSQSSVLEEQYKAGGMTVPRQVTEKDGKLYLGETEIPADQVDTVKVGGKDVKVVYDQATPDDLANAKVDTYQKIIQSLPEVVQADRAQTEQMNRMLGYSAALQSIMEPYQQQANALADTYAAQAGANPMIAPLADAFRVGQQGIANAYAGQAAAMPFQVMFEQQAKAAQYQAQQQAELERQLALEQYKQENGNRAYPGTSSSGSDPLAGLGG